MSNELATAYVSLAVSTRGLGRSLQRDLGSATDAAAASAGRSGGSKLGSMLKKYAAPLAVGAVLGKAVTAGLNRSMKIENAQAKLKGLGATGKTVAGAMTSALDSVKGTAFGLDDAVTVSAGAMAAGVKQGKELTGYLKMTADAATIAGTGMGEMGQMLNKVQANGKAQMDNINQFQDRGIPILSWLGKEYGKSGAELSKMVAKGQVDSETFKRVITENIGGAALESGNTTQGAFANMNAALSRFGQKIVATIFPSMKTVFGSVGQILDALGAKLAPFSDKIAAFFDKKANPAIEGFTKTVVAMLSGDGVGKLPGVLGDVMNVLNPFAAIIKGLLPALKPLLGTFVDLGKTLGGALAKVLPPVADALVSIGGILGNTLAKVLPSIVGAFTTLATILAGALGQALTTLAPVIVTIAQAFADVLPQVADLAKTLGGALGTVLPVVADAFVKVASALGGAIAKVLPSVVPLFGLLADTVVTLAPLIGDLATAFAGALTDALPTVAKGLSDIGAALVGGIQDALPTLVPLIQELVKAAVDLLPALLPLIPPLVDITVKLVELVTPILASKDAVYLLIGAFAAWKSYGIAKDAISTFNTLKGKIGDVVGKVGEFSGKMIDQGRSASDSIRLAGMYAKDWIKNIASVTGAWIKNTAAAAYNRASIMAGAAANAVKYAALWVVNLAKVSAQWAINTGALLLNKAAQLGMAAASKIAAAGQWILNAALSANPIGLVVAAVAGLVAALVLLYKKNETVRKIIDAVWAGIKKAIGAVGDWFVGTLWPLFKKVLGFIAGAFKFYVGLYVKAWTILRDGLTAGWNWIRLHVFDPIKTGLGWVRDRFGDVKDSIGVIWGKLRDSLSAGWSWISQHVFDPLKAGVGLIRDAFGNAKDGIGKAWEGLKSVVAKPVNFVLETVYNNGIAKWWNKIASAVHLDSLKLDLATPISFARGTEDHRAQIARGGAMRLWAEPETGGEAYIPLAKSKRRRSSAILGNVANRFGMQLVQYGKGGLWDKAKKYGGDAWDKTGGRVVAAAAAGAKAAWSGVTVAARFVKDGPAAAIKSILWDGIVHPMLNRVGGGQLGDILAALPKRFIDALGAWAKDKSATVMPDIAGGGAFGSSAAPKSGKGIGWKAQEALARQLIPGVIFTSAYRPNSRIAGSGAVSYHALGRAVDMVGGPTGMPGIWNTINAAFGNRSQELLYSPMGSNQILRAGMRSDTSGVTKAMHYNHVHWAMANGGIIRPKLYDQGGVLPRGTSLVSNQTSKPEAVMTGSQLSSMMGGKGTLTGIGKQIIAGLVGGIKNAAGSAYAAMRDVGSTMLDAFNDEMEIASPSKKFFRAGRELTAGIKLGVTTDLTATRTAITNVTNQISKTLEGGVKTEADRLIAARRKANDRIRKQNDAAAKAAGRSRAKNQKALAAFNKRVAAQGVSYAAAVNRVQGGSTKAAKAANAAARKNLAAQRRTQLARNKVERANLTAAAKGQIKRKKLLPALRRDQATAQARKNLAQQVAGAKKANTILAAQQKLTDWQWKGKGSQRIAIKKGTRSTDAVNRYAGLMTNTRTMVKSLTKAGNWVKGTSKARKSSTTMADIARASQDVQQKLTAETATLNNLKQAWGALREQVSSTIRGELDLTSGMTETTDQWGYTTPAKTTFATVAGNVAGLAARAKAFAGKLSQLVKKGIPAGLVQEVASLGTEKGMAVADALLTGTSAQVKSLAANYAQIDPNNVKGAVYSVGKVVADQMYASGISAQQGLVNGLVGDLSKLNAAGKKLAAAITTSVNKALKIKSPSRVMAEDTGVPIVQGVIAGINSQQQAIDKTMSTLVDPSRVNTNPAAVNTSGNQAANRSLTDADVAALSLAMSQARPRLVYGNREAREMALHGVQELSRTDPRIMQKAVK